MSEIMRPIPFSDLINWSLKEYEEQGSIFGVRKDKFYRNEAGTFIEMFGEKLSSPVGPAAGPNGQLTQNIVASYLAGSRFVELKTVQIIDGEDLSKCVPRPCINAEDECYNVEWSTEFTVPAAFNEYVKAWFAIHVLAKELGISDVRDFAFNMSVGYDLEGIKSDKVNTFIDGMIDASNTEIWKECKEFLLNNLDLFKNVTKEDIENISPAVSPSITLSTLHGCPPDEIERIATYLLTEKHIHTYIKCNPTLLGYESARKIMDDMGYDYVSFDDHHFNDDLQFDDAISMLTRLIALGKKENLDFGVKITNTFPVEIKRNELPGEEMYMSGRSLYPLSTTVALRLSKEFKGELPISYSGGADFFNIDKLVEVGIQPITVATTILKPGGYERLNQLAKKVEPLLKGKFDGIKVDKLESLVNGLTEDKHHLKNTRTVASLKTNSKLGLFDCFMAPCRDAGCPINQQIPEYVNLVSEGKFDEAFEIIAIDNALPSVTGTICDHNCQNKCVRNDYESSVSIRKAKGLAAGNAQDNFLKNMKVVAPKTEQKAVVIGAGPAGIAVSYFLQRNGLSTTVLEKSDRPFGIVEHVIPGFRIGREQTDRDYNMAVKSGVTFKFNVDPNYSVEELKKEYDYVIIATGAWKEGITPVKEGGDKVRDALEFLADSKAHDCNINLGKRVAIIGAGDVAFDCARAALRAPGVEESVVVYRRTREFMPAMPEEIEESLETGVKIKELLAPVSYDGKKLTVEVSELTEERDASGRKTIRGTGKMEELEFDTVIGAVGARVDSTLFQSNGIVLDKWNRPIVNESNESSIKNVYIAGDCKAGAATIVKAIADAKFIAKDILAKAGLAHDFVRVTIKQPEKALYEKKGVLKDPTSQDRCLSCDQICEICCDVCPNRANVSITINKPEFGLNHQIIHLDGMCNECGNCGVFCPHVGNPYKDKITLFWTEHDFVDSTNKGYLPLGDNKFKVRIETGEVIDYTLGDKNISNEMRLILETLVRDYSYYFVNVK
ncbi:MAG TPA: putative selenate reductase subunit YgfK [Candidatus Merdenecus merdavium]|nr:putative selenate reductase subunit YgfK [Candidatus Merdenecus merdavium]